MNCPKLEHSFYTPKGFNNKIQKEGRPEIGISERPEKRQRPTLPLAPFRECGTKIRFGTAQQKKRASDSKPEALPENGSDLLSHLRSTIGVNGLNFSVRNGKRWNPATIAT